MLTVNSAQNIQTVTTTFVAELCCVSAWKINFVAVFSKLARQTASFGPGVAQVQLLLECGGVNVPAGILRVQIIAGGIRHVVVFC